MVTFYWYHHKHLEAQQVDKFLTYRNLQHTLCNKTLL